MVASQEPVQQKALVHPPTVCVCAGATCLQPAAALAAALILNWCSMSQTQPSLSAGGGLVPAAAALAAADAGGGGPRPGALALGRRRRLRVRRRQQPGRAQRGRRGAGCRSPGSRCRGRRRESAGAPAGPVTWTCLKHVHETVAGYSALWFACLMPIHAVRRVHASPSSFGHQRPSTFDRNKGCLYAISTTPQI